MRDRHRRSRAAAPTKRKHLRFTDEDDEENKQHRKKRHKRLFFQSRTETLTLRPHSSRSNLTISNSFQAIQSPSTHRRKNKNRRPRRRNSAAPAEGGREWVFSLRDCSNYKDKVVVVSYNILGVENASKHPDLYLKVPAEFLDWERRKELICDELNHYNAGVLCLQEVDRFSDLDDLLQKNGFKGVYKARTGDACDGCAIFWKDKLFSLLHEENIEFQSYGLRNNVAQFCVLKMNDSQSEPALFMQGSNTKNSQGRCFVVGNIHVLFNPKRGDIKLGQVRLFLDRAYKLSQEWSSIPVVLGGDLNSIPQSAIYQFLSSSELNILQLDRRNISGQLDVQQKDFRFRNRNFACTHMSISSRVMYRWSEEEIRLATGNEGLTRLRHHLKLHSAYIGVPGSHRSRDNCGEPLATSYHAEFMGTVDYIWHTEELIPVRVLETVPVEILRRSKGLPNERWGSDHLALVCELAFSDTGNSPIKFV